KGHAMFDPVCAVRSSRALRPGKGLDGGKEARVARLHLRAGPGTAAGMVGLVALLALTSSGTAQELPAVSTGADTVVPPAPAPRPRPLRPRGPPPPSRAIELQRRGEFEKASVLLREAQAQKDTLTSTEQKELSRLLQVNRNSLATRQQARQLLAQAEEALRQRQVARGRELVRRLMVVEQALPATDHKRLDDVRRGLGILPSAGGLPAGRVTVGGGIPLLARTKVQQARALLGQGNFDEAERIAQEAANLNAEFGPKED